MEDDEEYQDDNVDEGQEVDIEDDGDNQGEDMEIEENDDEAHNEDQDYNNGEYGSDDEGEIVITEDVARQILFQHERMLAGDTRQQPIYDERGR